MSLLGTPVYANPDTPIWLSAGGDTIDGPLIVNGTLEVNGGTTFYGAVGAQNGISGILFTNTAGSSTGLHVATDATGADGLIETNGTLYLGRDGAGTTANTTFVPSAPTTNGDVLSVGGRIVTAPGGGISPLASSAPTTNCPIGANTPITLAPPLPTTAGKWYDVQVTGYWSVPIGTIPALDDTAEIQVSIAGGTTPGFWAFTLLDKQYPGLTSDVWPAGGFRPFNLNGRLLAANSLTNLVIFGSLFGSGTYPAGLDAVIQSASLVQLT